MSYRFRCLPLASIAALALVACSDSSPTEPARASLTTSATATAASQAGGADGAELDLSEVGGPLARALAAADAKAARGAAGEAAGAPVAIVADPAKGGNGGGKGGGKGGGRGGNGGNGGGDAVDLRLEIQPATWNTNWERSEGTVSALLRGRGAADVDRASVKLVGEAGEATAVRVQVAGGQARAFFAKDDALAVLADPDPGETHTVEVHFTVDGGEAQELTFDVRVVGPRGDDDGDADDDGDQDGEVDLLVQPSTWNVNWSRNNGTVSVLLRGDVDAIDEDSIVLAGAAGEATPVSVKSSGHQVRIRFAMRDAIAILDDPDAGETHEIEVRFTTGEGADATDEELTARIRIVGPRSGG